MAIDYTRRPPRGDGVPDRSHRGDRELQDPVGRPPGGNPQPQFDPDPGNLLGECQRQMDRVVALLSQLGLRYVQIPRVLFGVGVGIGFSRTDFVVVSILGGGAENQVMITSGILKDITQDRVAALEAANSLTRNNTAYPVFLHDAQAGWSMLMQTSLPIPVVLNNPQYLDVVVQGLPGLAEECRATIAERWPLEGVAWEWTDGDLDGLLIRSLI